MKSTLDFLTKIYSQQCKNGDYVIISAKPNQGKGWKDIPIKYHKAGFRKALADALRSYPMERYDLYWSPVAYSGPNRRLVNARETKFLAQDIDEMDNPNKLDPKPSYIWESSPNKYQGLWELDRYIGEGEYTPLNKRLAEHIGCDDCFDLCHVYRIPGTINHKYRDEPKVQMPEYNRTIYKPKNLKKELGVGNKPKIQVGGSGNADLIERKIYAKYSIPQGVRNLLALDSLEGVDRSSTIWYIENKLHELGMNPNEIIHLVKNSIFNKYKGRADADKRLRTELEKIIEGKVQEYTSEEPESDLKVASYHEVMSNGNTFGGWLVKGFWGRRSHGIVAGMPKCFKSTLVHDLIISVASGKPFLGKYPVLDPGPVIVVQNENADYVMKDRTEKLILHRGLGGKSRVRSDGNLRLTFPEDLPIHFINQQGFLISNKDHQKKLEKLIEEVKPVLVVLDPLYLMFDGDLNSAKDLNPALNWLLSLKNNYNTSVMVIHHYNKGGAGAVQGGARMMGSVLLYGWVESAWYLSKPDQEETDEESAIVDDHSNEPSVISMSREFRMAGSYPGIDIHLKMGEMGDPYYEAQVTISGNKPVASNSLEQDVINLVRTSTVPMSKRAIMERLGINKTRLNEILDNLISSKRIVTNKNGFSVYNLD